MREGNAHRMSMNRWAIMSTLPPQYEVTTAMTAPVPVPRRVAVTPTRKRYTPAPYYSAEDIAPGCIRPKPVSGRWPLQKVHCEGIRVHWRDPWSQHRQYTDENEKHSAYETQGLLAYQSP